MVGYEEHMPYDQRSQDMEEILGTPPTWIARWGTVVLMVIMVLLILLASVYTYPDVVTGRLTLTTIDPPRPLRARQDFMIDRIEAKNGDSVAASQVIVVARTQADFFDVSTLDNRLFLPGDESDQGLAEFSIPDSWNLGEIKEAVYEFQEKQEIYKNLKERRLDGLTTRELQQKIVAQELTVRQERQRQGALEDELERTRERLSREEQLAADGLDNREQLNLARRNVEIAEDRLQASRTLVRTASFDIELMRNQIESYRDGVPSTLLQAASDLRNSYDALRAAVSGWMQNYTVMSPVRGMLLLNRDIRPGAFILRGDDIATIIPANPGDMIGRIRLPVRGSGSVANGQKVMVRFDSYPFLEYGSVEGRVVQKNDLQQDGFISVEVSFPKELLTTTGNRLVASPLMEGEASIITDEKPLLRRFFDRF
ncbi:HlyD family efflux transporter periplasmic adaptor subunit [Neolewinella lacunae]|uniref:HlyD family efflux transporter periplasmic adaptor subunit n=1 Tax=Neolewinella lacunae TaxID=1517758 RepID=A0A923PJS7_9BACT|nr:HlyD family efflux transporter periplasmic adaptor subunit [Neolewinella lacunae]MBC6995372.1 HlyD family efflux transporter periplasmic adaptor subunit [Neolewinella lacunae]MDN3633084.1 HlyD family efflux transporter periplasmic adaptor subunit [Neolewinella lacunae]